MYVSAFFFAIIFCITLRSINAIYKHAADSDKIDLLTSVLEQLKISNAYQASKEEDEVLYGSPLLGTIIRYVSINADKIFQQKCFQRIRNNEKTCANGNSCKTNSAKDAQIFCNKEFSKIISSKEFLDSKEPGLTEKIILKNIYSYLDGGIFHSRYSVGESRKKIFKESIEAILILVEAFFYEKMPENKV